MLQRQSAPASPLIPYRWDPGDRRSFHSGFEGHNFAIYRLRRLQLLGVERDLHAGQDRTGRVVVRTSDHVDQFHQYGVPEVFVGTGRHPRIFHRLLGIARRVLDTVGGSLRLRALGQSQCQRRMGSGIHVCGEGGSATRGDIGDEANVALEPKNATGCIFVMSTCVIMIATDLCFLVRLNHSTDMIYATADASDTNSAVQDSGTL